MTAVIGITSVWSMETWGDLEGQPGGILYSPLQYSNAIFHYKALPFLICLPTELSSELSPEELAKETIKPLSGIFFAGGGGARLFKPPAMPCLYEQQPLRYSFEAALIKEAWALKIPVIGACRGHQMIVEVLGGKIKEERVNGHNSRGEGKTVHSVTVEPKSRLYQLIQKKVWDVNSLHCQVAEKEPPGFSVSARSEEGYIEAMEADGPHFWMSYQFHPEMMLEFDPAAQNLLKAFIEAAAAYSNR